MTFPIRNRESANVPLIAAGMLVLAVVAVIGGCIAFVMF